MIFFKTFFTLSLLTLSLSLFATSAAADTKLPLTKQSAAELVKSKSQGKILSVDEETDNGNIIFVIKIVDKNGKVNIFSVDAETGRQLH